jgi:prepilin-type N-terminal cleavage/methylation domain-containing protein
MRRKSGFTLVEVLVVIGIIALLAGMLLGGLNAVRRRARKANARSAVDQIATAWTAYYVDYKHFPDVGPGSSFKLKEMNEDAVHILHGNYDLSEYPNHTHYQEKNPRGTAYMEFHEAHTGGFNDPWGNMYQLALDEEPYDNEVNAAGESLKRNVAVWSMGPDGTSGTADDVRSWDKY